MPKRTLNDRIIKALKPAAAGQRRDLWDTVVPGFGVRSTDKGRHTYMLASRFPGSNNPTRRAIAEVGALSLVEARTKARHWLDLIKRGVDPAVEVERERLVEQRKRANIFCAVAEDFIRDKLPGERKGREVERDVRRDLIPAWGARPIAEIAPHDVRAVIKLVKERGPYQAHNLLGHVRRLFSWAIDQQVYGLEMSPCDRLKPSAIIGEKRPRKRILTDDELRAFWRATARLPYPYSPTCRLLLLTGQRHSEVAKARWSEFHPELVAFLRRHSDSGKPVAWHPVKSEWELWSVGEERFKSDAPHMVPLADAVVAILATLPRFRTGDHLFSTTFGERPTVINDKVKGKLDARMLRTLKVMARLRGDDPNRIELKPWVLHDLRRTMRSHLSALRIPDHIAEMTIGHGRRGLQRIYDQHRYLDEMKEALTQWSARLRGIVEPPPANVIALRG